MPELPEAETVRRGLAPMMEGARFAGAVRSNRQPCGIVVNHRYFSC